MTVDLIGRRLLIAAYWYYELSAPESFMTDAEYDRLCRYVADRWNELEPVRQWALGSPEKMRSTGSHFKHTTLSVDAAFSAYFKKFRRWPDHGPTDDEWEEDKKYGRYVTVRG